MLSEDAVRLAEVGLDRIAEAGGVARVVARLHAMRAKALAAGGDRAGCLAALTAAERALDGGDDHEHATWCAHFDEGSLAAETAAVLHALGDLGAAERQAGMVLRLRGGDRVRALAFGRLTLAAVLVGAGRVEEAVALGQQVAAVAPELSSVRVRSRLGELAMQVDAHGYDGAETSAFLAEVAGLGNVPADVAAAWPV